MLGVCGRGRAEVYLLFHRRHKELVVGILIDDAHLFEPSAAAARFLFELFVDMLRDAPARRFIHDHFAEHISLTDIAKSANVSETETLRCFKFCMQMTLYRYLLELRLERAAKLLRETDEPVTNIADMVGFSQVSYFGKCFKTKTGRSPKEYREKCNSKF